MSEQIPVAMSAQAERSMLFMRCIGALALLLAAVSPGCQNRPHTDNSSSTVSTGGGQEVKTAGGGAGNSSPIVLPGNISSAGEQQSAGSQDVLHQTRQFLVRQGLSAQAAEAIVQLNAKQLRIICEEDRHQWEKTVNLLARLGSQPEPVQTELVRSPELAGLLAGSLEAHKDGPLGIAQSLPPHTEDRQAILKLYELFSEAPDAIRLADLLHRDRDLVLRLIAHDALELALPWLLKTPEPPEVRKVYDAWVRQVFQQALESASQGDENALDRAIGLLDIHALRVCQLLQQDEDFRQAFLEKYWPRFETTVRNAILKASPRPAGSREVSPKSSQPSDESNPEKVSEADSQQHEVSEADIVWWNYVADPRVWDYFHQLADQGTIAFEVFDRWGLVAVDLVLAEEYRPIRGRVLEVLEKADERVIEALADENLRSQPLFVELMKRNIRGGPLAKALWELRVAPAEAPQKLAYWHRLSDQALIEELGPPPEGLKTWIPGYGVYYWVRKVTQGREMGWGDHIWAAVDTAEALFMVKGLKPAASTLGRSLGQTLVRRGIKEGGEWAAKAQARQLAPLVLKNAARTVRSQLRNITSRKLLQADITPMARYTLTRLRQVGIGRKTLQYLTDRDVRVLMRSDRRVVIRLPDWLKENSVIGRLLWVTAENAGFDLVLNSPAGQEAIQMVVQTAKVTSEAAAEQLQAWREHLALWWIAVHTGALDEAIAKGIKNKKVGNILAE